MEHDLKRPKNVLDDSCPKNVLSKAVQATTQTSATVFLYIDLWRTYMFTTSIAQL